MNSGELLTPSESREGNGRHKVEMSSPPDQNTRPPEFKDTFTICTIEKGGKRVTIKYDNVSGLTLSNGEDRRLVAGKKDLPISYSAEPSAGVAAFLGQREGDNKKPIFRVLIIDADKIEEAEDPSVEEAAKKGVISIELDNPYENLKPKGDVLVMPDGKIVIAVRRGNQGISLYTIKKDQQGEWKQSGWWNYPSSSEEPVAIIPQPESSDVFYLLTRRGLVVVNLNPTRTQVKGKTYGLKRPVDSDSLEIKYQKRGPIEGRKLTSLPSQQQESQAPPPEEALVAPLPFDTEGVAAALEEKKGKKTIKIVMKTSGGRKCSFSFPYPLCQIKLKQRN